jgi:hypothetical protein
MLKKVKTQTKQYSNSQFKESAPLPLREGLGEG